MLDIWFLLEGLAIGVVFSAPIGPVNIMCIQQAFRRGFWGGLAAGLGAVAADVLFAAFAAYGITAVSGPIAGWSHALQAAGGLALLWFGLRIIRDEPQLDDAAETGTTLVATALASFGMTITNPATVLGFVAVFGSLGDLAPQPGNYPGTTLLVLGILAGGTLWWILVAGAVSAVRSRMTHRTLIGISRTAGGLLLAFGGAMLLRLALL